MRPRSPPSWGTCPMERTVRVSSDPSIAGESLELRMPLRVAYLGRLSSFHAQNTLEVFAAAGYDLLALNTNRGLPPGYDLGSGAKIPIVNSFAGAADGRVDRWQARLVLLNHLLGREEARDTVSPQALQVLAGFQPDLVYAAWGSNDLADIATLSRHFPGLPIIHSVQCFPLAVPTVGTYPDPTACLSRSQGMAQVWRRRTRELILLAAELRYYGRVIKRIAGRIECSPQMSHYIQAHYPAAPRSNLLWMERYSRRYAYRERLPRLSDRDGEPHLVFLGRTDFSHDRLDDIRFQLAQCARAGIHVHLAASAERLPDSPYIHRFAPWDSRILFDGALATFCTQFDACAVWYNADGRSARMQNTIPSRFLFAFPAAIPIVLPAGTSAACEEVVSEMGIGFTYSDIPGLKDRLNDRPSMLALRERALEIMPQETFEARFERMDAYLRRTAHGQPAGVP